MFDTLDRDAVAGFSAGDVLAAAETARRTADRAEVDVLLLAAHFADLHPVVVGAAAGYSTGTHIPGLGEERAVRLAGDGTPDVAEFAPEELAAALGIRGDAAKLLIGAALELRHRLPRLWSLMLDGRLQPWRARQVAAETTPLSTEAAAFVDRHLAVAAARNRVPNLKALVHEALLQHDPDAAAGREQAALDHRGVWTDHRESTATSRITILADTLDAVAFDETISEIAGGLGRLGDADDLDVRRARAVGLLAAPQRVLDLFSGGPADESTTAGPIGSATVYVHVDGGTDVAHAEQQGAMTLGLLRDWLGRLDHVTVRPVLDLNRTDGAVDGHQPPAWMRETVILRDRHCVFPNCSRSARACDLDHIVPYVPLDEGGPAAQTRPDNLAPLCRRHHRVKTHGSWRYVRNTDGGYIWTTPHGARITVDALGTRHPPEAA